MATNAEYLRRVPIFMNLSDRSLDLFAESCTRTHLDADEVLIEEGELGRAMYILVNGRVRVERLTRTGEIQVLGMRGAGEVIGEMSLIDNQPRAAQVVTVTRCRFLVMHHVQFTELILREPSASLAVMQSLSMRLREADNTLVSMRSQEVHERLLEYLVRHADEAGWVHLNLTQKALAEVLGCSRETVNRALTELVHQGSIARESTAVLKLVKTLSA